MISRLILLSIFTVSTAFMMLAENADSCVQSQRTQEQFQQEFNEFIKNTRAYMLAQEIIPIDSVHLLNTEQNKLLKYTRNLVKKRHNKIKLPIEINSMLGDSLNEKRYESILHFNKAYFIKMSNCKASLVIPMQAKVDTITINSELNIITAEDDDIYRIVYTAFTLPSDSVPQYMYLKSSVNGFLYSSVFMENDQVVAEVKGNDVGKTAIIDSHKHQHPMNNTSIYEKAGVGRFPQIYISDRLKSLSRYTALDPSYMMKKDRSF